MNPNNKMTEEKSLNNFLAAIETILFVYGEPIETAKIAKILTKGKIFGEVKKENVKESIKKLNQELEAESRGLKIIFSDEKIQLATKSEFGPILEEFIKDEFKENLSPASLETLALIAYLGPMSRAELDFYRGVNSSFILRSLLIRGLVNRTPHPERGNVYLYQISFDLLKYLGLSSIEELPDFQKFKGLDINFQGKDAENLSIKPLPPHSNDQ